MWKFNVPDRHQLEQYKVLKWMKPLFNRPYLWHWSRRGVAMGAAIGVFFGIVIPVLQTPLAAGSVLLLRANLPAAVVSTFISNPITVSPLYFAAYQFGDWLYDTHDADTIKADTLTTKSESTEDWWKKIGTFGKPLMTGLLIFSVIAAVLTYYVINLIWLIAVRKKRRRNSKIQP